MVKYNLRLFFFFLDAIDIKIIKFGINTDPAEAVHIINEHLSWIDSSNDLFRRI